MCELRLPRTLMPLYSDLPRIVEVEAGTVDEAIGALDERWPGVRDRLCEAGPALRMHIHVYVDKERADLDTPVGARSEVQVVAAISGG
jgi:molybdopterin synthase sulfur carrier subunit